ncbi:enolase C-terminal domain-like protein [Microbacterium halophytorum]|uniref:enolase C-terminal domain-like protein n=1 Tax=Microbacterium halophytorum TaxID=2067568 RepID=UPI001E5D62B5|nr:enolase C-terminal domain-like protein [Microbacterium halophytorum]
MAAPAGTAVGDNAIRDIRITPVAFADPPLLNTVGVHEPFALRAIVQMRTGGGAVGLGETYGDAAHLARLALAAEAVLGGDVFAANDMRTRVARALAQRSVTGGHGMSGMVTGTSTADRVLSPFDVAALDIRGKILGVPVSELLGGRVRGRVPFSGYLFYKWEGHPSAGADRWGPALNPEGIVEQARSFINGYGFGALKLKGGVFAPDEEAAAMLALREAFPEVPLRIDPNGAWSVDTSVRIADRLKDVLEYLEDPTVGLEAMAEVRRRTSLPLATNMWVVAFEHIAEAVRLGSIDIVLSDHHFWGGLERSKLLAGISEAMGWGLSMHSNSHLGISLAAMTHLAAATPVLDYACDTHWPWKREDEDVVAPGTFAFDGGALAVPNDPGLGVELDTEGLERLHRQYIDCGIRERDDTGYMKRFDPSFENTAPRW